MYWTGHFSKITWTKLHMMRPFPNAIISEIENGNPMKCSAIAAWVLGFCYLEKRTIAVITKDY